MRLVLAQDINPAFQHSDSPFKKIVLQQAFSQLVPLPAIPAEMDGIATQ